MAAAVQQTTFRRASDHVPGAPGREIDIPATIGPAAFARLPARARARFGGHDPAGHTVVYRGIMHTIYATRLGWLFALTARLIGSPVISKIGRNIACTVTLMPDHHLGGTIWHRHYDFPDGPVVAATTKRCDGNGAPVESFNRWFGMSLDIREVAGALHFITRDYFAQWRGVQIFLPRWLSPGRLEIIHRDESSGSFHFIMTLTHPVFGVLMHQDGQFHDPS